MAREIIQQNITYRQKYCYELCFKNYLSKYAVAHNVSIIEALWDKYDEFDKKEICSHRCPLECSSTSFDITQNEIEYNNGAYMEINFFYTDLKYTEFSQSIKTTEADLISNTGGVLGIFLELSFMSAYRLITFIFDIIFI